ncbi:hypothetical protein [Anderseniella sp. Alg231-50]|uniref:hypothetical protein n=1 Tax=Anderseniella sp. Alg231-50 TaxID=1922226 RepID=UPI000D559178
MIKKTLAAAIMIGACGPVMAGEFDQHVKACHDAAWAQEEFKDIPNAGVSAYPGGYDDKIFYSYWIIDWDDVQVAGKCTMELNSPKLLQLIDFRKK